MASIRAVLDRVAGRKAQRPAVLRQRASDGAPDIGGGTDHQRRWEPPFTGWCFDLYATDIIASYRNLKQQNCPRPPTPQRRVFVLALCMQYPSRLALAPVFGVPGRGWKRVAGAVWRLAASGGAAAGSSGGCRRWRLVDDLQHGPRRAFATDSFDEDAGQRRSPGSPSPRRISDSRARRGCRCSTVSTQGNRIWKGAGATKVRMVQNWRFDPRKERRDARDSVGFSRC